VVEAAASFSEAAVAGEAVTVTVALDIEPSVTFTLAAAAL